MLHLLPRQKSSIQRQQKAAVVGVSLHASLVWSRRPSLITKRRSVEHFSILDNSTVRTTININNARELRAYHIYFAAVQESLPWLRGRPDLGIVSPVHRADAKGLLEVQSHIHRHFAPTSAPSSLCLSLRCCTRLKTYCCCCLTSLLSLRLTHLIAPHVTERRILISNSKKSSVPNGTISPHRHSTAALRLHHRDG